MSTSYPIAIHIFRRDFRLHDNSALIQALKSSAQVIPCFIFDKRQIELNDYKSEHCIQFMVHSLKELAAELSEKKGKLYFFYGIAEEIIEQLFAEIKFSAVFVNRDYTPFSLNRDKKIENFCRQNHIDFHTYADALLHEPEQIFKSDHKPYTVFTPFQRRAMEFTVATPQKNTHANYYQNDIALEDKRILAKLLQNNNPNLSPRGGRNEGLKLLKAIHSLKDYKEIRNIPAQNATTHLSAHNKFGTISIREVYAEIIKQFGKYHTLISELYWRDFFTHIGFHFPHVFGGAFHAKYQHLKWPNNEKKFRAWCEGMTGFPIVDAGMREMNATGYMHNRVRMITASFLTKDLHVDWRLGEKYFAQKLVDYDPAVNNGNWQWAASTGCDAQPYFRIFNPWLQQKKFDADCLYIKRWILELSTVAPHKIHELGTNPTQLMTNYPNPIINHQEASQKAKLIYTGDST